MFSMYACSGAQCSDNWAQTAIPQLPSLPSQHSKPPATSGPGRWWAPHLRVMCALCFIPTFNHFSPFTHLRIKDQISVIKATMCTTFYQLQRYCGITILINLPLWRMSVVVGVGVGVLTNAFSTYLWTRQICTYCGPSAWAVCKHTGI